MSPLFIAPLRRAHVISPFGPGALTLMPNRVSVIVTAPRTWLRSEPVRPPGSPSMLLELTITDRHLQAATGVQRFVQPPAAGDDPIKSQDWLLPAARFPLAEACANPGCQRMVPRDNSDVAEGRCDRCTAPGSKRRWPTFQVATVLACQGGHLADVDWDAWLHAQPGSACAKPDLGYQVGASPDRPTVRCYGCARKVTFAPEADFPCPGQRPWLPGTDPQPCQLRARPIERTSTSMHYTWQLSALTLPIVGATNPALLHALSDNTALTPLRRLDAQGRDEKTLTEMLAIVGGLALGTTRDELVAHLDALAADAPTPPTRAAELDALTSADHPNRVTNHLPDLIVEPRDPADYRAAYLGPHLTALSAIPRLRETRVMAGFTRIEPAPADPAVGYEQLWGRPRPDTFPPGANDDWLPGYRVYGEGILLVLDPDAVERWVRRAVGAPRLCAASRSAPTGTDAQRPLQWLLAHTLAHLLMRAAAPESGYPLPALRERVFATDARTAFLVYTAAGDVHGTLGGLVELAEPARLVPLLNAAVDSARWCATDPVCGEDATGARTRGTSPGACHHCLYVPETSCEAFNHGLDRALVQGQHGVPGFLA